MNLDSFIRNVKWRFGRTFFCKKRQEWQKVLFANEDFRMGRIIPLNEYYRDVKTKNIKGKRVVCIYDGKIKNGGLADRLRGIISVYEVCKELSLEFKLIFNSPFELQMFLEPNKIDWCISKEKLNYNTEITDICYIDTLTGSDYEVARQKKWFTKEFKKNYKEFHVRTNALFSYNGNYSQLFNELFKPTERLAESIQKEKRELNNSYISTSFRFMNLLGDFNETTGINIELPNEEKNELIEKNLYQLQILHERFPDKKILVNSDSTTFLQMASKFEYVHVNPGNVTHIDANNEHDEYEVYEKTFLDFFTIANADRIFLLRTGKMYKSGYPYAASKIYNRPFEIIEY